MVMGRRGHLDRQAFLRRHKGIVQETAQGSPSLGRKPQCHGAHKASQQTYLKMGLYPLRREVEFMYSEPAGEAAPLSLGIRQGCDGILCSNVSQGRTAVGLLVWIQMTSSLLPHTMSGESTCERSDGGIEGRRWDPRMLCCTGHTKSGVAQNASDSSAVKMPEECLLLSEKEWNCERRVKERRCEFGSRCKCRTGRDEDGEGGEKGVERS
jgi:hypothetical protein